MHASVIPLRKDSWLQLPPWPHRPTYEDNGFASTRPWICLGPRPCIRRRVASKFGERRNNCDKVLGNSLFISTSSSFVSWDYASIWRNWWRLMMQGCFTNSVPTFTKPCAYLPFFLSEVFHIFYFQTKDLAGSAIQRPRCICVSSVCVYRDLTAVYDDSLKDSSRPSWFLPQRSTSKYRKITL